MSIFRRISAVFLSLLIVTLFAVLLGSFKPTLATLNSCTVDVFPTNIPPNSSGTLDFLINNTDQSANIVWVKITSPSGNFTINSGTKEGWSASVSGSYVTFTGGSHSPGVGTGYFVNVSTAGETPQAAWTVQVSDSSDGSGATSCTGDSVVAISNNAADTTPPYIQGDITVTNVNGTTVALTWTTDEAATSVTNYGLTDSYGLTQSETSPTTSHSVTISSLSENTTYVFSITNSDTWGNSSTTEDFTFTTSNVTSTVSVSTTTTSSSTSTATKKTDVQPPKISLKTDFSKPFKDSPTISGSASDDISVSKVDYSIDGGKNWLSVKITPAASVNFSFKQAKLEDGNYDLVVRATDSSGKTGTDSAVLIIDKLPPAIGGNNIFLGPQNIFPGSDGTITTVMGTQVTIAVNAVGGPTAMDFMEAGKSYPFNQIEGTNIWKGKVMFKDEGKYDLSAVSVDGAGNKTERKINAVNVLSSGKTTNPNGILVKNAKITLYVFSDTLNSWSVWDAGDYGQENPLSLKEGKYGFLIPEGKYYMTVQAEGYRKATSEIFTAQETSVINSDITLTRRPTVSLFGRTLALPSALDFGETLSQFDVKLAGQQTVSGTSILVGTKVPDLTIRTTSGKEVNLASLRGRKVVLTFLLLTTWSPASQEQLAILDRLSEQGFESLPIFMMESEGVVKSFLRRGGYSVEAGIDPDGELLKDFPITSLPQHFVISEDGTIKATVVGAKSQSELRKILEEIQ